MVPDTSYLDLITNWQHNTLLLFVMMPKLIGQHCLEGGAKTYLNLHHGLCPFLPQPLPGVFNLHLPFIGSEFSSTGLSVVNDGLPCPPSAHARAAAPPRLTFAAL